MRKQTGFTLIELMWSIVMLLGIVGWVANIFKLVDSHLAFASLTMVEGLRVVGIFVPPLGAVMGFV